MHSFFKSFEGKNSQVQAQIAKDINSDKVGPDMNLDALVTDYSTFLSTLNAGKISGKINQVKCTKCNKKGHTASECRGGSKGGKGGKGDKAKPINAAGGKGGKGDKPKCTKCGKIGHKADDC